MLAELGAQRALLVALDRLWECVKAAFFDRLWGSGVEPIGPIVNPALNDPVAHGSVAVMVHHRAYGSVDRDVFPVNPQTANLGVKVGEVSAL